MPVAVREPNILCHESLLSSFRPGLLVLPKSSDPYLTYTLKDGRSLVSCSLHHSTKQRGQCCLSSLPSLGSILTPSEVCRS